MSFRREFALIIGAMKAGTTSLFDWLSQHPAIAPCRVKEPCFFTGNWEKGWSWYESLWDESGADRRIALEASTDYAYRPGFPDAAERMAACDASFKFVYLLRDPIERIVSQHDHALRNGWNVGPLAEGVHPVLIQPSRYAYQLDAYARHFPRERMLLLDFEQLKSDPAGLLAETCAFLGIDSEFEFRAAGAPRNTARENRARRHPAYRLVKRLPFGSALLRRVPEELKRKTLHMLAKPEAASPGLRDDQREKLMEELSADMRRLEAEYGFDVSRWGF